MIGRKKLWVCRDCQKKILAKRRPKAIMRAGEDEHWCIFQKERRKQMPWDDRRIEGG